MAAKYPGAKFKNGTGKVGEYGYDPRNRLIHFEERDNLENLLTKADLRFVLLYSRIEISVQ